MPDTEQEKTTGRNDCNKCKYSAECKRFQNELKIFEETVYCRLGVK